MTDLDTHYAVSTGALHTAVMYAEICLRVALENKHNAGRAYFEHEMEETLVMLQKALKAHRERDDAVNAKLFGSVA